MENWTPEMIELEKVANKLTREKQELIEWLEQRIFINLYHKDGIHMANKILQKLKGDEK